MYCKYCGKQIADDSTSCQYCGGKVDVPVVEPQEATTVQEEPATESNKLAQTAQEVVVSTKDRSALQVEITKKSVENTLPLLMRL